MAKFIRINPSDNVAVAVHDAVAGEESIIDGQTVTATENIPAGHKMALEDIGEGENVIKYGFPIRIYFCQFFNFDFHNNYNYYICKPN